MKIFGRITLVRLDRIKNKIFEARKLIGERDSTEILFLATALSIENSIIWSNDFDFKTQKTVKVVMTKDLF